MRKLKVKSEEFFMDYVKANGGEISFFEDGRMKRVKLDGDYVFVVDKMRELMGTIQDGCSCWDKICFVQGKPFPRWLCEEVEGEA